MEGDVSHIQSHVIPRRLSIPQWTLAWWREGCGVRPNPHASVGYHDSLQWHESLHTRTIYYVQYTPYSGVGGHLVRGRETFLIPVELNNSLQIDSSVVDGCSEAGLLPTQMQSQCIYQAHGEYNDLAKQDIHPARRIVLMGWVRETSFWKPCSPCARICVGCWCSSPSCESRRRQTFNINILFYMTH